MRIEISRRLVKKSARELRCETISCIFGQCRYQNTDFSLSGGCFGTDIIKNCTKLSNIGVHGLIFWPIFAKFQCASFLIRKNVEKNNMVEKTPKCGCSWKDLWEATCLTPKLEEKKSSNIIHSIWINLIIYNNIW